MIVEDQSRVIAFLETMGPERRETHLSEIFLGADRVWKLKRAVKLPYADFSSAGLRRKACHREVELNREAAPVLYLGTRDVTAREDGGLELDGPGPLVDCVVEMVRFDEDLLFDRLASRGELDGRIIDRTADAILRFHRAARPVDQDGAEAMGLVMDINRQGFAQSGLFGQEEREELDASFRKALDRHRAALSRRSAAGRLKLGHGDLHLRNICLFDGEPLLFDRLEFNDAIATVDVLYDLAFLAMDLWHAGLPHWANRLVNRYFDLSGEGADYRLMPFFMAVRAAIRAHVTATQWEEDGSRDEALAQRAYSYVRDAREMLSDSPPVLIAIGGLSGTGKSTVADDVAHRVGPTPGARILESDRIRKGMFHVPPEEHLPPEAYAPEISGQVYSELRQRTLALLGNGASVIADAVFANRPARDSMADAARASGAPFTGIWLTADADILRARVAERHEGASDADLAVLESQLARGVEVDDWRHVDAARDRDAIAVEICRMAKCLR